jgi:nucleoside-triphosphatase THEP1
MTILVIIGAPGIGKTTAVIHIARTLKDKGIKQDLFYNSEV